MISSTDIITIILTSTLVSAFVSFLLKVIFENRQQHRFNLEIEKLKNDYEIQLEIIKTDMAIESDLQRGISERRLDNYPKLVELIYRTRNLSREISNASRNPVVVSEFQARVSEFSEMLYKFRIDLERDGLFPDLHTYKNLLKSFYLVIDNLSIIQTGKEEIKDVENVTSELKSLYGEIELMYKPLIDKLSRKPM